MAIPFNKYVQVLKHDKHIFALDKPCGILSHPNKPSKGPVKSYRELSIIDGFYCEKNENFQFKCPDIDNKSAYQKMWLLNRLDSATSGVILVSETENVGKIVKKLFKNRQVKKQYFALVFGDVYNSISSNKVQKPVGLGYIAFNQSVQQGLLWENDMSVTKNNSFVRATSSINLNNLSRMASTTVKLVEYHPGSDTTLLMLSPHTGFTHQLRFQCAANGFPIVGDKVYGDFAKNRWFADRIKSLPPLETTDMFDANSDLTTDNIIDHSKINKSTTTNSKNNSYKRLFLHSHRIEFSLPSPAADPSKSKGECEGSAPFVAESPVPSEFYVGRRLTAASTSNSTKSSASGGVK
jgi:tRNA pseudouridine65 synthase